MAQTRNTSEIPTATADSMPGSNLQYEVASLLARSETVADALAETLTKIAQSAGWEAGAIWLAEDNGDLSYQCGWHKPGAAISKLLSQIQAADSSVVSSLADEVLKTGDPVWIDGIRSRTRPMLRDTAATEEAYNAVAFSLGSTNGMCGLVALFGDSQHAPDADTRRLLRAIGCDIGQFLYARKASDNRLERAALLDETTGLPSWNLFLDRGRQMLLLAERNDTSLAVLHIHLDFSAAEQGRDSNRMANELLALTAERLRGCVRAYDTVARLSHNEFMVLLPEMRDADDALLVAHKIVASMAQPLAGDLFVATANTSVGIARHPQDGFDMPTLLQQAKQAVDYARSAGINQCALYGELAR